MKRGVWRQPLRLATMLTVGLPLCLAAGAAKAQDRFEIQVYDSETAPAGSPGIELHANVVTAGTVQPSAQGELPTTGLTHLTLEPHVGLTRWCELGGYLQAAQRPDGTLDAAGVKLRLKLRLPRKVAGFGFALNFEFSDVPRLYEANQYGSELRPVVDFKAEHWYASVNPIVGLDLAGDQAFHPQFQPAAKVAAIVGDGVWVGAEYYGAFGASPSHTLYGALDWASKHFDLNAGVGYGFQGPERWVLKTILGFHPAE